MSYKLKNLIQLDHHHHKNDNHSHKKNSHQDNHDHLKNNNQLGNLQEIGSLLELINNVNVLIEQKKILTELNKNHLNKMNINKI